MTVALDDTSTETAPDVISLTIPASIKFVRLARIGAAALARRRGLSVRAIDDLRLAIDEVFTLLLGDEDRSGFVDVTYEIDESELLIGATQRLDDGPLPVPPESLVRFEVVLTDLVDDFDADPELGVVRFTKRF